MAPDQVFNLANTIALPGWALLCFFPSARTTSWIVKTGLLSGLLSLFYVGCLFLGHESFLNGGGFQDLSSVKILFANDWTLVAGWVHYLAFDLLIGSRVQDDLAKRSFLIRIPCLLMVFMLGPMGWLISRPFSQSQKK